jgi:energy-coupling factor transporter ATP-binding protein EcfA2
MSSLIELGAGFHPDLTGRENVQLNGAILGLSRREIRARFDDIVAFAELERFIDTPVKRYSSGMYARLGFAVAIHVDPEVLLIDEVLAVGDESFTRKCLDKIGEFRRRGKTILIVTHSLGLVEKMCDEVLWLRRGKAADKGDPKRVVDAYLTYVAGGEEALMRNAALAEAAADGPAPETAAVLDDGTYRQGRWGSREVEIAAVRLLDDRNQERHVFVPGERLTVELDVRAAAAVEDFVFGIGLFTADGVSVYGTNTHLEEWKAEALQGAARVRLEIDALALVEGTYLLDVAAHRQDGTPYDYHRGQTQFRVKSRIKDVGVWRPAHRWSFAGGARMVAPEPRPELDLHEERTREAAEAAGGQAGLRGDDPQG